MGIFGNNNQQTTADANVDDTQEAEKKKTTPDEGKTFEKDTVFVCVQDCYQQMIRYRKGAEFTGKKCPPHFVLKAKDEGTE